MALKNQWIKLYSNFPSAQNQLGARHSGEQHISLLKQRLSFVPVVFPAPEYCAPILLRPDLHAGDNIFVTNDDSMSVTSIINWQDAAVRLLFAIELNNEVPDTLDHIKILHRFRRIEPRGKSEGSQKVQPVHAFIKTVHQLRLAFYIVLRLLQTEDL